MTTASNLLSSFGRACKWHDGKPFTAADVACTFDLLISPDKLRRNPRSAWWGNVEKVTADGDFAATFHLKHRQPSLLALLASGYTPIYPCHVPIADMRRKPIGTGPFKFVEFKMNEGIKLAKNTDYWKPGRPYLDGIEYTIIADRSTRMLAFASGKFDMTFPTDVTVPLLKNIRRDAPKAQCTMRPDRRQHQSHRQPRRAAVRRSADPPRARAHARPAGLHRHPESRARARWAAPCCRRRTACGACRRTC